MLLLKAGGMGHKARFTVFSLSVLILLYVTFGHVLGQSDQDTRYRSLTVYSEVLNQIQENYVDDPNLQLVTIGALHGLLQSLDPESSYLSPKEYDEWKTESQDRAKGSTGLVISRFRGYPPYIGVVSNLPGSPALTANVREGDILEGIAGFTTQDMSIQQAQLLLDGAPGSQVKVSVVRSGSLKPQDVEVTRAVVPHPPLLTTRLGTDIAYMRVAAFEKGSARQIRAQLLQFKQQGASKLILDLRGCASGEPDEAIDTAQFFLSSGTIASLRGQTISTQTFSADPRKAVWSAPVTVLISGSTAGPAEILAAAIADNHRGETVGQHTLGLASEQKLIPLADGSALLLTVGIYYTPADKPILNQGLAPTVQVPPPNSQAALLNLQDVAPDPIPGQLPPPTDPVVKQAVEILQPAASASNAQDPAPGV